MLPPLGGESMYKHSDISEMLSYIDPVTLDYNDWLAVGMAIKHEGGSLHDWDEWSKRDASRYHAGDCAKKWESFREEAGGIVTGGTLYHLAKDAGWYPGANSDKGVALDWDSIISDERDPFVVVDTNWIEGQEISEPSQWEPVKEITTYLQTLFDGSENVGYVTESWYNEDAKKYLPTRGSCSRTADELIGELGKCGGDIGRVFGDYNKECGAWIRFNPLDGHGVKNANVTDFRYALVESDDTDIARQNEIIRKLELPVAVMVYSGGKSLHAIVRIDAKDYDEYRQRVDYLYAVCEKNGLSVDRQNRNPSRLSRMPGVERKGKKQFIVDKEIGKASWDEWREWIEAVNDNLPDPENMADAWDDLPALAPPLIDGVLRQGHKMLLAGPSKAGKSFALIEMAIAIAEGGSWFGWKCSQGRVMYVNLELDRASCLNRFHDVYEALRLQPRNLKNIDVWNLRGKSVPMDKLAPKLIRRAKGKEYIAVIIDPIYKIITGDENSAGEMAHFCNQFDRVCTELECAVIYCHHHSKGEQASKRSMDRASGSGVFARDPDALIDLLEITLNDDELAIEQNKAALAAVSAWLDLRFDGWRDGVTDEERGTASELMTWASNKLPPPDYKELLETVYEPAKERVQTRTGWIVDGTLREYRGFLPRTVWFDYPIHYTDNGGMLDDIAKRIQAKATKKTATKAKRGAEQRKLDRMKGLESAFSIVESTYGGVTVERLVEYTGKCERTVRNYIEEHDGFKVEKDGRVIKNV